MKIKTSELIGPALDWAVAKCEGVNEEAFRLYYEPTEPADYDSNGYPEFHYSTYWSQGGPIIERERLNLSPTSTDIWDCWPESGMSDDLWQRGPTPLVAAMRCFVASKLGDKVEVPEELL